MKNLNGQMSNRGGVIRSDGTILWIIDDVRDCLPVGVVASRLYLPAGYIKANGALVNRADYPRLVKLATDNNLWTNDFVNCPGLFGIGDGNLTMQIPDWRGMFKRFLDDGKGYDVNRVLGSYQEDEFKSHTHSLGGFYNAGGFSAGGNLNPLYRTSTPEIVNSSGGIETRPKNIAEMAVIRY